MPPESDKEGLESTANERIGDPIVDRPDPKKIPYPRLELISGPQEGLVIALKKGEQVIGRSRRNAEIALDDTSVSRRHVQIAVEGSRVLLHDLGSRNGTFMNGERLESEGERELKHLDIVKIGIYIFGVAFQAFSADELAQLQTQAQALERRVKERPAPKAPKAPVVPPPPPPPVEEEVLIEEPVTPPPPEEKPAAERKNKIDIEDKNETLVAIDSEVSQLPDEPLDKRLRTIFIALCVLGVLIGGGFFALSLKNKKAAEQARPSVVPAVAPAFEAPPSEVPPTAPAPETATTPPATQPGLPPLAENGPETPSDPAPATPQNPAASGPEWVRPETNPADTARGFSVFVDVKSAPTAARIYFKDAFLGTTPLKAPIEVKAGQEYVISAEFELREINDRYQQKLTFKADPRQEVVPLVFNADIGAVKVQRLPRGVDFYLEGYYAYDKYRANPVRLDNISYGKPIYVPYGQYVVELRETTRVGSSQTYVKEIRYRREFDINADRREVELTISDRDLQFFPARVQSNPTGATVIVDGQKVGTTPFAGELPIGKHDLKLSREGFFEHVEPLDMRVNTPFELKVDLKTSKVGALIQQAMLDQRSGNFAAAINGLVEALKIESSSREKAQVYLMLGDSYLMMGNAGQAILQFERARSHPEMSLKASLGLARASHKTGNVQQSLTYVIEVLINAKEGEAVQAEAQALFKQLSPLKSVLFITTEPKGATVSLNGREIPQKTPVILSELTFGNYRIEITKPGFVSEQVRKNLKITEFAPVVVQLKPEKL